MCKTLKFVDGDMERLVGNNGYTFIEGKEKLQQDVEMILTSDIRATTGLGCGLDKVIGQDTMSYSSSFTVYPAVFDFQQRVILGLSGLRGAQKSYQYGDRSSEELVYDFSPARVWYDNVDPRNFNWAVEVYSVAGGKTIVNGSTGGNA